ncbi:Cof-type HAD-IIB family hydrolase [Sediminibacillus massiliensis]|uniref:Cof-type HAD-IIB family hydrolase n=1 Tax=Sediminibacillus massiliensis TaxID=1926277 RepID=UPI00098866B6|nr:Cof-type HAD-IIB family hydrolase [Sediminibacillus massiliensis]
MEKQLVAIDLDGTLLNSQGQISKENIKAIREAQSVGIEVVIATGRGQFDVRHLFKGSGIQTWIIGANGATVHKPSGELFHSVALEKESAVSIIEWLEKQEYYYEVFSDDQIYTPLNGKQIIDIEIDRIHSANPDADIDRLKESARLQFGQFGFSIIPSVKILEGSDVNIYNILAFSFDKSKLAAGIERFKNRKDITLVSSGEHNFELEDINASKGIALNIVAEEIGVKNNNIIAIGDSQNDLSMFEEAGLSFAMNNAGQFMKNAADEITLSNDENGVAMVLRQLMKTRQSNT